MVINIEEQGQETKRNVKNAVKKKPISIPKGKPKSGRIWKSERTKFSSNIKTRSIHMTFEKKRALKEQLKYITNLSNTIKRVQQEEEERRERKKKG
ncbi:hypothetical protein NQ317_008982 [Molorchus minor]|uniref:Coiled-coil domain-containing protein 86 n=1 Tax=Molorchus minor TaxID=1323400 RepID=A0ABQ9J7B3_9CUCU|nr:hypothetical protein NQ317_008982 [Molorchus minor]